MRSSNELNKPPLAHSQKVISPFKATGKSALDQVGLGSPIQLTKTRNLNQTTSLTQMGQNFRSKGDTLDSDLVDLLQQSVGGEGTDANPIDTKFKQLSSQTRETKLASINKILVASNDMKDRVIRDLRTEIIEKAQKID